MTITDVLIIGAGPCGLAVAARLSESTPSALFTDDEHDRYWRRFKRKETLHREAHRQRKQSTTSSGTADSGYASESELSQSSAPKRPSITVLDATSDKWMGAWHARFKALSITHLRSPLFFHPDPRDRDGLLAYAYEQGREAELLEIPNVVGKEVSKHSRKKQRGPRSSAGGKKHVERHLRVDDRDRIDYFTPSTRLFADYCDSIVKRYRLEDVVQQAAVTDIRYGYADDVGCPVSDGLNRKLFAVETKQGSTHWARIVIVASGPASSIPPCIPLAHNLRPPSQVQIHASHVFAPGGMSLPPALTHDDRGKRTKPVSVAIVGGGLTAFQHACTLLRSNQHQVARVHIIHRAPLKLKPFDIDLPWVTKTRNSRMSEFLSADSDVERAEMLKTAKGGGSVSPLFWKGECKKNVERGQIVLHESMEIEEGDWEDQQGWRLTLRKNDSDTNQTAHLFNIAHIFYATGMMPNVTKIPFLQTLQGTNSLEATINGLPVLTDDVSWSDEVPGLLFTGALAALRLGPGAANLAGARLGAERVAWKVEGLLGSGDDGARLIVGGEREEEQEEENDDFYAGAGVNRFSLIAIE